MPEHESDTPAGADARNGGRREGECDRAGHFPETLIYMLEDGVVFLIRGFAMSPFLQRNEEHAAVARVHPGKKVVAGDRTDVLDSGRSLEDLLTLSHHGVGALEGRGVRQDDLGEEVTLIFLRQEAARDALAEHSGEEGDTDEQNNGDERFADEEAADAHIAIGRGAEASIEPVEELLQQSFAFFLRLQQHRGERGRKGERIERRDDDRYGDRHGELLV